MMALLQRALKMHTLPAESKKISMDLIADSGVAPVWGNGNQLLQAFLQIIENAIDALEEVGGGQLMVTLKREGGEVIIQFSDNGPGIRDPQRVFDPFYTTKPIGKGTGLGLSATYGVVQDHNGQIHCHNKAESGAVFTVRLPMFTQAAETMSANA
jgi:signal transduction histidine kinase